MQETRQPGSKSFKPPKVYFIRASEPTLTGRDLRELKLGSLGKPLEFYP